MIEESSQSHSEEQTETLTLVGRCGSDVCFLRRVDENKREKEKYILNDNYSGIDCDSFPVMKLSLSSLQYVIQF